MKGTILSILFLFVTVMAYSQKSVSADSLKYYEGEIITVCQKVSDTFVTMGGEKTTFLNFGYGFPNQLFTVVIYQEDLANFSYNPSTFLKGKNVCVIGDVRMFNSGPEIIVEREDQIKIQSSKN